jgi:F-type H+-transporting ATPase subunit b
MIFLEDSAVWLLISFLIFASLVYKFGKDALLGVIDARISHIKKEIQSAENLRIEAQELLAQYQRRHRDSIKEAEKIIATAEKHAEEIRKNEERNLKESIARREKQMVDHIAQMEIAAINQIRQQAANLAITATAQIIAERMDNKTGEKLIDQSISSTAKNLH